MYHAASSTTQALPSPSFAVKAPQHLATDEPGVSYEISKASARQAHMLVKPEVLAPAGGWPQVKSRGSVPLSDGPLSMWVLSYLLDRCFACSLQLEAAVENGADAVYFGLSDFSARAR
jgi:hypothetical protein